MKKELTGTIQGFKGVAAEAIYNHGDLAKIPWMDGQAKSKAYTYLTEFLDSAEHPNDIDIFPKGLLQEVEPGLWEWHRPTGFVIRFRWTANGKAVDVELELQGG